jgi:hypothetical protein
VFVDVNEGFRRQPKAHASRPGLKPTMVTSSV